MTVMKLGVFFSILREDFSFIKTVGHLFGWDGVLLGKFGSSPSSSPSSPSSIVIFILFIGGYHL